MISKVDETKKITISLGGSCRLRCEHCYITTPQFKFQRRLKVKEVESILKSKKGEFSTICISGDTDPLLNQEGFASLLKMCSTKFPTCHISFTTRLLPDEIVLNAIQNAGNTLAKNKKLIFPSVSFLTYRYPNSLEDETQVPSTEERIQLVHNLSQQGFPVLAAMRPTMPFSITPKDEIIKLIQELALSCSAILGEVFLDDAKKTISTRLNLPNVETTQGELTFLEQPSQWNKSHYIDEINFTKKVACNNKVPFFLRSMSAVNYIEKYWDYDKKRIDNEYIVEEGIYDQLLP